MIDIISFSKQLLLVLLPIVSLLYSIGCTVMVYMSCEYVGYTIKVQLFDLALPNMLLLLFVIILYFLGQYHYSTNNTCTNNSTNSNVDYLYWIRYCVLLFISIRLSYKAIIGTKYKFVDGGPDPIVEFHKNTTSNTSTTSSQQQPVYAFNDSDEDLVILITGANSGIGKDSAIQLAILGATKRPNNVTTTIIVACRTIEKGIQVKNDIEQQIQTINSSTSTGTTNTTISTSSTVIIDIIDIELCSYQSIRAGVTNIINKYPIIHCLINNAGVMMKHHIQTIDNMETTIHANYLGHFLLTCLLLPHIIPNTDTTTTTSTTTSTNEEQQSQQSQSQSPQQRRSVQYVPRIINVTSSTYALTKQLPINDLNCTKNVTKYTMFTQYSLSKLCNILFTQCLYKQYTSTIFVASIHPGIVRTDVTRNFPLVLQYGNIIFQSILQTMQKSSYQGCWNTVYICSLLNDTSPMNSGKYWMNRQKQSLVYNNNNNNNNTTTTNDNELAELWYESCKLVQLTNDEQQRIELLATNNIVSRSSTSTGSTGTTGTSSTSNDNCSLSKNDSTNTTNDDESKKVK